MGQNQYKAWISKFISHLNQKGRDDLTLTHYRQYLSYFGQTEKIISLSKITEGTVLHFKKHLKEKGLHATTQNYYLIALRNFIRFLPEKLRPISYKSIELNHTQYKAPKPVPKNLIVETVGKTQDEKRDDILQARDKAIVALLMDTGIKLKDLVLIRMTEYKPRSRSVVVQKTKHSLKPATMHAINAYLEIRFDDNPYLFAAHDRALAVRSLEKLEPLATRSVQRLIARAAKASGNGGIVTARTLQKARR